MREHFYSGKLSNYPNLNAFVACLIIPVYFPISVLAGVILCGFEGGCVTQYRMLVDIYKELEARYFGEIPLHRDKRDSTLEKLREARDLWLDPATAATELDVEAINRLALDYVRDQTRVAGLLKSGYYMFSSPSALITDVDFDELEEAQRSDFVLTVVGLQQRGPAAPEAEEALELERRGRERFYLNRDPREITPSGWRWYFATTLMVLRLSIIDEITLVCVNLIALGFGIARETGAYTV